MNVPMARRSPPASRACLIRGGRGPLLRLALLMGIVACVAPASAQEVPELRINSVRYIVIDADTGEIFAQRRARERAAMASLTKIFTAIEAIEAAPPSLPITTSVSDMVSEQASTMGFGPDERFTLEDLLHGLMLPSGNDAARAIARTLGAQPGASDEQAVARFVDRINQRVRDMGLTDTTLVNPDGWGVPGHFTSAHDLAAFTMYALEYPRFVNLISTKTYQAGDYPLTNNNRLLNTYPGLIGGKTGFDEDSGWCLVEVAERGGDRMISVTLDGVAPDDWYDDNRVLLDYAFAQKAERRQAGRGVLGEVVGYFDPDAAVITRIAGAGASLGRPAAVPAAPGSVAQGNADAGTSGTAPRASDRVSGTSGSSRQLVGAIGVAAALILARTLGAFRATRSPRPETPAPAATVRSAAPPAIPSRSPRPPVEAVAPATKGPPTR